MILTLTINPAVDKNILADRLVFEDRASIVARSESAGGRGINASRVLHSFGADTIAIATSGGATGERFEELLAGAGFPVEVVKINAEIRSNLTITDHHGLTIKLNEAGPVITKPELADVQKVVSKHLDNAEWLMLCGSVPPDVPSDFYCELIEMACKRGVKTLLDTDGDALLHGIGAKPTAVSPNQAEAERLLNRVLMTRAHFVDAALKLKEMGPESVLLSLGSHGAIGADQEGILEAVPPRIEAVSPIGAGDAMAAAFVWARAQGYSFADSVRWGVAEGTASAQLPGLEFATPEQSRAVYKHVEIRSASAYA